MVYIAKHYIRVGSVTVKPGEAFEAEYNREQEKRMVRLGAIELTGKTVQDINDDDIPAPDEAVNDYEDVEDIDEGEAPEIDVMDGIEPAVHETKKTRKARCR